MPRMYFRFRIKKVTVMEVLFAIIYGYLLLWVVYLLVFSVAGLFYKTASPANAQVELSYAVLIPAYKEDKVIVDSVTQNLQVVQGRSNVELFVIADQLQSSTMMKLERLGVTVLEVDFEESTKAKAINFALTRMESLLFSHVIILDADNVLAPSFFDELDKTPTSILRCAQTQRTAKNLNTPTAILDGLNEEMGNHIFRKGHTAVGLSSALIGSGMIFERALFTSAMSKIHDTAAEDKMLEFELLERRELVHYLESAVVYDEKVSTPHQFEGQRKRWVAARFFYAKKFMRKALNQLIKGNFDYFNKWLQFVMPQKSILIIRVVFYAAFSLFFEGWRLPGIVLFFLLGVSLVVALHRKLWTMKVLKALVHFPVLVFKMIGVLLRVRSVDTSRFNVTPKGLTE